MGKTQKRKGIAFAQSRKSEEAKKRRKKRPDGRDPDSDSDCDSDCDSDPEPDNDTDPDTDAAEEEHGEVDTQASSLKPQAVFGSGSAAKIGKTFEARP